MVYPHQPLSLSFFACRLKYIQVGQRKAMVLIVIGEESQSGVLVLNSRVENELVPLEHLVEAAGSVNDVRKFLRADSGHGATCSD